MVITILLYAILSLILIYISHQLLLIVINKYTQQKELILDNSNKKDEYLQIYDIISKQREERKKEAKQLKTELKKYMLDLEKEIK